MKNMLPIYKKEIKSYLYSPIAYVVAFMFLLISGYFFYFLVYNYAEFSTATMRMQYMDYELNPSELIFNPLISNIAIVLIFLIPLLTMKVFAEEKKHGTIELLFTYPVTDWEIIMGKFLALLTIYFIMIAFTFLYPLILSKLAEIEVGVVLSGYIGIILFGMACIATGLFASSLTENQIIAASITFGILLLLGLLPWSANVSNQTLQNIFNQISLLKHIENATKGIISTRDIIYYFNYSFVFLFFTARVLESRRWRG